MSKTGKLFMTGILLVLLFIPIANELLALPVLAALGYIWGFAATKS
ncbi:MAG TPA: hypothetical protein VH280_14900 [Verrucomicrobiae bacterium]|jgi:hypothetical protein|nr:hypothetical protein [Verrucomicrobiae bacterium]